MREATAVATRRRARTPGRAAAPPGRGVSRVGLTVVVAVMVVLLAIAVVLGVWVTNAQRATAAEAARRQAVLSAGRQESINFTTIGYKTVGGDVDRVIGGATGDFRASYRQNRKTIKKTVTNNKSTSKGEVLTAALVSMDSDSAVALVVADASVTNVSYEKPTLRHYRMRLDLVRKGGRWLVSDLTFVS